ncbi:zinc finger CCCH domain-containing protein 13-like isoform X2 [Dreissena polymorpha]|uniref:zinc finger CCCH domain-containing protein 13-like isoform X2 n=1 Tax=Dreissena polymorpha TaxID=45954 RepID=UPI0022650AAA|nr:zinc finger CCCH domain-containing protein 13-like isoform X2 [Dreissena polymorpha]
MSKNKRKVTVDADDRKKPSVFERLGPNAIKRPVGKYNDSDSDEVVHRCRNWDTTGTCSYGKACKFLHDPKSKLGKDESQEDLRLRVKHKGQKRDSRPSDSEDSAEKDYEEKLELERERQALKRQLSQLEDDDKDLRENFRIESRLQKVSSSESDSSGDSRSRSKTRKQSKKKKKRKQDSKSSTKLKLPSPGPGIDSDDHQKKHKKKSKKKHSRADSLSSLDRSSEPEQKGRKLLSPLKFKNKKPLVSNAIQGFHSDDEPDVTPQPPKMKLTMPSRSPPLGIIVPPLPPRIRSTRSRSLSSGEGRRGEKIKAMSLVSPVKKKKAERRASPEFERESKIEKVRGSRKQTKSRSPSFEKSLSFSPDGKKARKAEKKKKKKDAETLDKSKDTSLERSRGYESRDRELSPLSDFRSNSPLKKKKKDKKNKDKKKDRAPSPLREEVVISKKKKDKMKARDRSMSPVPKKSLEKRSLDRSHDRKELEPRGRSPMGRKMSRSPIPPRRARSPDPAPRADRDLDVRDRDNTDSRESNRGDLRGEARDFRGESRGARNESRELRDSRPDLREPRGDSRELRGDGRDLRGDPRDSRLDQRDSRPNPRESRLDIREPRIEPRDSRTDMKDSRLDSRDRALDTRESRLESRVPLRDMRDKDSRSMRDARPDPRDRETRDRDPLREPLREVLREPLREPLRDPIRTDARDRDLRGIHEFREEPLDPIDVRDRPPIVDRDIRDRPPIVDRDYERDLPPPVDVLPDRRDRFPDDRYRDEPRRDRYDDPRYPPPPPPPAPVNYDDRPARFGRPEPGDRFPDPVDRGPVPYGRPDRDIPVDRRVEPMEGPYDRYGQQNRGDGRYGGIGRGGRYDYQRDEGPNWDRGDRGRGRNRGNWNRGGPQDRGGRYDDRSRRGDWENQRQRNDDFYPNDRRDWAERKDGDRKDDRPPVKDESRDRRDDKPDAVRDRERDGKDKERDPREKEPKEKETKEKELQERDKEDKRSARVESKKDERIEEEKEKKEDKFEKKEETNRSKDTDSDSKKREEEKSRDKDRDRQKERGRDKDDDRRDRGRSKESDKRERGRGDKESVSSRSRDGEVDREKRRDDSSDRSRKRKASRSRTRSPSVKKPKDGSPALSTHSKRSAREPVAEKEPEADKHSDKGSVAGSERSRKADSTRARSRRSRKDEEKQSKRGSDTEDRKRSRSRSHSNDSKDSKRLRLDSFTEGAGALAGYVIKDTVGSDREDNNLDNIEQNFSDWSDDSADDILNRPGEASPKKDADVSKDTVPGSTSPHGSEGSCHSNTEQREKLDSEESISSDEGGLVERVKMAAVDALEIDWSSLIRDERPKPQTGSALNRFKPGAIFSKIGLSRQYAGNQLFSQVLEVCQKHELTESQSDLNDSQTEAKPNKADIKQEETTLSEDSKAEASQSPSKQNNTGSRSSKFNFLSDVAMFHASGLQKLKERMSLMSNIGPFRRALCARKDLEMRRQLCRADKVLDSSHLYASQDMDLELFRQSVHMLRNAQDPSPHSKEEVMSPTTPVKPVGSPVTCP